MTALAHRPFSAAWAAAFHAAIEADAEYREAAARWTWPVAFVLDAAPEFGYADAVAVELALDRGRCHGAAVVAPESITAPFVLRAAYPIWKAVVRGELAVISAVTRRLVAVEGSLATLMLHTRSATALVACAQRVPTHFPDES